jgi:hypothetical protein
VSLTCSGVPAAANCVIAPNPVAAGNFVGITITTTAAAVGTPRILPLLPPAFPRPQILLMLAGLLLGVAWKIRSGRLVGARRWWTVVLPLAAGLLLTLGLAACGGGSGISYTHSPGTPAGTYTVTVTGTSTSGSSTLTHTTSLTLNVT